MSSGGGGDGRGGEAEAAALPGEGAPADKLLAVKAAEAEAAASAERLHAVKVAADAALEEEYKKIAKELPAKKEQDAFTDYRTGDIIFRRELGEPEFWLDRRARGPSALVLTDEQAREISRMVEIPGNQLPRYDPRHVLSKEYGGTSSYEAGLSGIREETRRGLDALRRSGDAPAAAVRQAEEDLAKLDYLYDNYHVGMSVFRSAKGGRDRAKK